MKGVKLEGLYREIRLLAMLLAESYIPFNFNAMSYGYKIYCCGKFIDEDGELALTQPGIGCAVLDVTSYESPATLEMLQRDYKGYKAKGFTAYAAHRLLLDLFENGWKTTSGIVVEGQKGKILANRPWGTA